ncbi:MAG TPA: preprotein translocase subunit YajC [Acidimicrobiia bacterium]|jgi:preprotein translocase subunit YajC
MEIALIYFAVLAVAFFLLIVRPRRRQATAHRELIAELAVGDDVMTAGGIFGTVRELQGDDVVVLEIAPATTIRIARGAVAQRVTPSSGEDDPDVPSDTPAEPPPDPSRPDDSPR